MPRRERGWQGYLDLLVGPLWSALALAEPLGIVTLGHTEVQRSECTKNLDILVFARLRSVLLKSVRTSSVSNFPKKTKWPRTTPWSPLAFLWPRAHPTCPATEKRPPVEKSVPQTFSCVGGPAPTHHTPCLAPCLSARERKKRCVSKELVMNPTIQSLNRSKWSTAPTWEIEDLLYMLNARITVGCTTGRLWHVRRVRGRNPASLHQHLVSEGTQHHTRSEG